MELRHGLKSPGSAESWGEGGDSSPNFLIGESISCLLGFPPPVLLKIPVWEAILCHLAIFNRVGRAHLALPCRPSCCGRHSLCRLNPGSRHQESASPTQPEMGSGPPPPRCCGGALGRGGLRALGDPPAACRPPSRPAFPPPSRQWETRDAGAPGPGARGLGAGPVAARGGLRASEPGRGVQLPFFRLPETRPASGGSTAALASSLPAGWRLVAPAGRSRLLRRPLGLEGAGRGGPRAARGRGRKPGGARDPLGRLGSEGGPRRGRGAGGRREAEHRGSIPWRSRHGKASAPGKPSRPG